MNAGAEQLLDDYNHYRFKTNNVQKLRNSGKRIGSLGKKNLPVFASLQQWCEGNGVEPRRWLASLFETRRWLFAPPLHQLKSPKHLKRYPDVGAIQAYQNRLSQERVKRQTIAGEVFDPNRDISNSAETLKKRYLDFGHPEQCVAAMSAETFGYHPKSQQCARCPLQQACSQRLQSMVPFDIMGLRLGNITAEQAKASVYYGRRRN